MKGAVFVTGATGFLGRTFVRTLVGDGYKVYAVARNPEKAPAVKGVTWLKGDITDPEVVREPADRERLLKEVTKVIHLAALYDLKATHEQLYLSNVVGTHNVLHLAEMMPKLQGFYYASTIAVAGDYSGVYAESMFDVGQKFPDHYAATKFAAEAAVRSWKSSVPRVVFRIGIVVGDSQTGEIPKVDGPYYLLRLLHQLSPYRGVVNGLKVVPLPFNERTRLYCIPVDTAAKAILALLNIVHGTKLYTYHLTGHPKGAPVRTILKLMLETYGYQLRLVPLRRTPFTSGVVRALGMPAETLFYMNWQCRFDSSWFQKQLPEFEVPFFEQYADNLFGYARENLFKGGAA